MADPVLTLDTIEDAQLLVDQFGYHRVRTGTVEGIDVDSLPDALVLEKALLATGMPGMRATYPGNNNSILSRVGVFPLANDSVRVRLEYEPINYGGQTTAYILYEGTTTAQETRSIHPSGKIVRVGYKPVGASSYTIEPDVVPMSVPTSVREIRVTAIRIGLPSDAGIKNYAGYVNQLEWPTSGVNPNPLGPGYWLMNRYETSLAKGLGYYQLTASAISRQIINWMMPGVLRDQTTGKFVAPNPKPAGWDASVQTFCTQDYTYDVVTDETLGMVNVGWFPQIDFSTVFGF